MRQFYSKLGNQWLDDPQVLLAFRVRFDTDLNYTTVNRRIDLGQSICKSHGVRSINDIPVQQFLRDLHTRGVLHRLPAYLSHFNDERLLESGPYGKHYMALYRSNWFGSTRVATAFEAHCFADIEERTQFIKNEIYWHLGVVSMTQARPRDFCEFIFNKSIGFTLPKSLVRAAGGEV